MQAFSIGTDVEPVPAAFFRRPFRDVFPLEASAPPVARSLQELMDRIEKDEILFDVRAVPTISRAGVGVSS